MRSLMRCNIARTTVRIRERARTTSRYQAGSMILAKREKLVSTSPVAAVGLAVMNEAAR